MQVEVQRHTPHMGAANFFTSPCTLMLTKTGGKKTNTCYRPEKQNLHYIKLAYKSPSYKETISRVKYSTKENNHFFK